jgi:hypothetical protein
LSKLSYGDGCSSLQQHHKRKEKKAHGHNMCVCVFLGLNFSQMAKKNQNSKK